jgi:AcrR family transcriptional regulator
MKAKPRKDRSTGRLFLARKSALTAQIAAALLASGVADIPLRDLAAKIGTSDRMLLYYFTDKADLVRSSLRAVSAQFAESLARRLPQRSAPGTLLETVVALTASQDLAPLLTLWADLSARGSRGEEPFRSMARDSVHWWVAWLEERVDLAPGPDRRHIAIAILTVLEGVRLLEAFVPNLTAGALPVLSGGIVAPRRKRPS